MALLKKIKTLLNKSLLSALFVFFFTIVLCGRFERDDDIDVTFFDVGQGHSTLINVPNGPSILIDAGEGRGDEDQRVGTKRSIITRQIVDHIRRSRPTNTGSYDLLLMATHADEDHSSWLSRIYTDLKGEIDDVRVVSFFGGAQGEYGFDAGLIRKLKASQVEFLGMDKIFASDFEYDINQVQNDLFRLKQYGPIDLQILAMNKSIQHPRRDTNPSSLIIRFQYGPKSIMISGDAPGDITDDLLAKTMHRHRTYDSLRSDILLLSHHGAKEKGANSMGWIEAVKPKYGVISAGFQKTYKHPTAAALTRLVAVMDKDLKTDAHQVASFGTVADYILDDANFRFLESTRGRLEYSFYETTYPLYTTRQSGDISFSWGLNDRPIKISFENIPIPDDASHHADDDEAMAAAADDDDGEAAATGDEDDDDGASRAD